MSMPASKLSPSSVIRRNPNQVFSEVDDEVVMLSITNSEYYNLNEIGSIIWRQLKESTSLNKLISKLTQEFEVSEDECRTDVLPFINELLELGIIEMLDENVK